MKRSPALPLVLAAAAMASAACGLGATTQQLEPPKIELSPGTTLYEFEEGTDETRSWTIHILNSGGQVLTLKGLPAFEVTECDGLPAGQHTFKLGSLPGQWTATPDLPLNPTTTATQGVPVTVTWTKAMAGCASEATLTIKSNDPEPEDQVKKVVFRVLASRPNIEAANVDFGGVAPGTKAEEELCVTNNGLGLLVVSEVRCSGNEGFAIVWPCERGDGKPFDQPIAINGKGFALPVCTPETTGPCCEAPIEIGKNESECVRVTYSPVSEEPGIIPADAHCWFVSNDADAPAAGLDVKLSANVGGKCLSLEGGLMVNFGSVVVQAVKKKCVDLYACGDEPVTVSCLDLGQGTDGKLFELDKSEVKLPFTLAPNQKESFCVTYKPTEVHQDATGSFVPDTGTVHVCNDTELKALDVKLQGTAINSDAPVCVVKAFELQGAQKTAVNDGDKVAIQAVVELDGKNSYDPAAGKLACSWSVKGPDGDAGSFNPSAFFEKVTYPLDVVGDYLFCLTCANSFGAECAPQCITLKVEPPPGCHVELTWKTPLDPDETDQCDGCGADLDLHVVHPYGAGQDCNKDGKPDGYFDIYFDCFWMNANPKDPRWCPHMDPVDPALCLPHLDRDDTNGGGPENFTYAQADPEKCYQVGVHYWHDHGFGASFATVKVWIDGVLLYDTKTPPKMKMLDIWDVGELCCAAGTFTPHVKENGEPIILKGCIPPDFVEP
ncbi:MAG: hypothetical protein FJ087_08170 [Deltaproteobacteria bacterium]|nr:hypothetical protein [Deltaproteobacteria bacterium]